MCGIVDIDGTLELDKLAIDLAKDLPAYARPIFIRLMRSLDMTGKLIIFNTVVKDNIIKIISILFQ